MELKIGWSGRAIDYTQEELSCLVEVAQKADPLTQGQYLESFEKKLRSYLGVEHAFAFTNATNVLDIIALLCRFRPGDEVILPAHTFCATAIPFGRVGAKLVWADIEPDTRLISVKSVEKLITPKTRAVIVVHLYGMPCEMDAFVSLCRERNLLLIEDCAQAFGAEFRGQKVGTFGDFAAFSLHAQKNITTLGEGGVLVLKDSALAEKVPGLRHNGLRPFPGKRPMYWKPAMTNVDLDLEGVWPYNFCMTEVQAALGARLLDRVDELNDRRIARARRFISEFREFPELSFQPIREHIRHVYHLLSARYDGRPYGKKNDDLIALLFERFGIKTIVQYCPLYRYPLFQKMGFGAADCPVTDDFFDNMISFPFHLWMSDDDFQYMIESVKQALTALRRT